MELSVDTTPHAGGAVEINGSLQPTCPYSRDYIRNGVVELEALPAEGYEFIGWSGDLCSQENPVSVEMNSDKLVTAMFANITHPLVIQVNGHGTTDPAADTYTYNEGAEITITATPASGWQFDGWSGEVGYPGLEMTTVTITGEKTVTANFSQIVHSLTIEVNGSGLVNPESGVYSYPEGTEVTITATPESGWQFDGWSDEVDYPGLANNTLTMTTDKTVTANFSRIMHEFTIKANGNGTTVPSPSIYVYAEGTEFTITATPESGWRFESWSGEVTDPDAETTTVVMTADKTVTATFSRNIFTPAVIAIIGGSVAAGLGAFFATRRRKAKPKAEAQPD
ncbi:MAG: InlB B-repeat-containing protein [Dehalococcoidales bacterium]|nr:InlB B-repeat-containing protein [Dehalococcoidales bacterium]